MNDYEMELIALYSRNVNEEENRTKLGWMDPDGKTKIVTSVGEPPKEEVPEPSLVAYLDGGGFVALWNADFGDFYFITPVRGLTADY